MKLLQKEKMRVSDDNKEPAVIINATRGFVVFHYFGGKEGSFFFFFGVFAMLSFGKGQELAGPVLSRLQLHQQNRHLTN